MPNEKSSCRSIAPGIASKNAGQPHPLSNLVALLYSGASQPAHVYTPGALCLLYLPVPARSVPFSRSTRNCVSHTTYLLGREDGTPLFLGARHGVGMRESTASEHGNLHGGGAEGETGEGHTWSHPAHTVARKRRTDIDHVAVIVRAAPGATPTRRAYGAAVRACRARHTYMQAGMGAA